MASALDVVPATAQHLASLPTWFSTPEALAQWGGSTLRFPLDAVQIDAMLAETQTEPPLRLAFAGIVDLDQDEWQRRNDGDSPWSDRPPILPPDRDGDRS